jgi:hypothetical protein
MSFSDQAPGRVGRGDRARVHRVVVSLAASLLFLFIGAPIVMIGVELLMPRTG